jgi:hypothetical protein
VYGTRLGKPGLCSYLFIRILQYATGAKKRRLLRKDLVCSGKNGDFSEVNEIVIIATTRFTDCSSDRCAKFEGSKNMVDAVANIFDALLRRIEKLREDTGPLRNANAKPDPGERF